MKVSIRCECGNEIVHVQEQFRIISNGTISENMLECACGKKEMLIDTCDKLEALYNALNGKIERWPFVSTQQS